MLYDSFLERDVAAIRGAIRDFRASESADELFAQVARFAVLAYAPSQHAKHAVIACLSAHDAGIDDELLTQCAIYAAASRQPWSEPPIGDPPEPAANKGIEELREAIAAGDRLRGERWLSARLADAEADLFLAATDDFEDLGHKLIVAVAAARLAALFPAAARFATLRIAVWEMTSYRGERYEEQGVALDTETLFGRLIDAMVEQQGDVVSSHALFLLDAALQTENEIVIRRVRDYLSGICEEAAADRLTPVRTLQYLTLAPYALGRDYGAYLKCHAITRRLRPRFPDLNLDAMLAAAAYNLEHAPSSQEFSFA